MCCCSFPSTLSQPPSSRSRAWRGASLLRLSTPRVRQFLPHLPIPPPFHHPAPQRLPLPDELLRSRHAPLPTLPPSTRPLHPRRFKALVRYSPSLPLGHRTSTLLSPLLHRRQHPHHPPPPKLHRAPGISHLDGLPASHSSPVAQDVEDSIRGSRVHLSRGDAASARGRRGGAGEGRGSVHAGWSWSLGSLAVRGEAGRRVEQQGYRARLQECVGFRARGVEHCEVHAKVRVSFAAAYSFAHPSFSYRWTTEISSSL